MYHTPCCSIQDYLIHDLPHNKFKCRIYGLLYITEPVLFLLIVCFLPQLFVNTHMYEAAGLRTVVAALLPTNWCHMKLNISASLSKTSNNVAMH